MKIKCQICYYGAMHEGFRGSIYKFRTATRKRNNELKTVNYENGELGCRKFEDQERESICLNNNFSKYKKFK